jgi:LysM repeat protein
MKLLKILGIAAGVHALALILIFSNPGCSYSKAGAPDASPPPISPAPVMDATPPPSSDATIRFSPTRPGTAVASALEAEPVSGVTPVTTYTVARGDSLWSIAKANQISRTDLAAANKLGASATLHVGQKLIIPSKARPAPSAAPAPAAAAGTPGQGAPFAAGTAAAGPDKPAEMQKHVVKMGETLGGIARKYGVRQGDIAVANNITDPKKIQPGQELLIPARSAASGKTTKGSRTKAETAAGEAKPAPAPAEQDLDAGLKPANPTEVPVVKIEDNPPAPPAKSP